MPATSRAATTTPRRRPARPTAEDTTSFAYLRQTYRVPANRGRRVTVDGRPGVITRGKGHYLMVRFDGMTQARPCHPTWRVDYNPAPAPETPGAAHA